MANIIITKEILEAGRSSRGLWSMKQIRMLGVSSFSVSLPKTIIGKEFPEEIVQEFLALKDKHLKPEQISAALEKKTPDLQAEASSKVTQLRTSQINNPASPPLNNSGSSHPNIIMTDHIIEKAKSSAGGWSRRQLDIIGVKSTDEYGKFKIPSGWKRTVIGKEFPDSVIHQFIELKDQHISSKKNKPINDPLSSLNLELDI